MNEIIRAMEERRSPCPCAPQAGPGVLGGITKDKMPAFCVLMQKTGIFFVLIKNTVQPLDRAAGTCYHEHMNRCSYIKTTKGGTP